MSGLDWHIFAFGVICIFTIARTAQSLINDEAGWRPVFWLAIAIGLAISLELRMPGAARFYSVMKAFIEVAARVL